MKCETGFPNVFTWRESVEFVKEPLSNELVKEGLPNEFVNEAGLPDWFAETHLGCSVCSDGRLKPLVVVVVVVDDFCESVKRFVGVF